MENLKETLELLYELQKYDTVIEKTKQQISSAPSKIKEKTAEIETKKAQVEVKKKEFVNLSALRKEKEALLSEKEQAIAKRSVELNSVKSNDVYKTIALEIEKAKADKSMIEDQILEALMKIDDETRAVKEFEAEAKEFENKIKAEIADIEKAALDAKEQIKSMEQDRQKHKDVIDSGILEQYERLRQGGAQAISIVENNACTSCGVVLRPQMTNLLQKGSEIVFCDGCSRILLKKN